MLSVLEREEIEKGPENSCEEIMGENLTSSEEENRCKVQEPQRISRKMNLNRNIP